MSACDSLEDEEEITFEIKFVNRILGTRLSLIWRCTQPASFGYSPERWALFDRLQQSEYGTICVASMNELDPAQLPLIIRLKLLGEAKEYVLLKTKQDKLLLNKPNGEQPRGV